MNAQEIFDTVIDHLVKQGRRATNEHGACVYRHLSGLKCAVGFLITDEEYQPFMEGCSVHDLFMKGELPERLREHVGLLGRLQIIHDTHLDDNHSAHLASYLEVVQAICKVDTEDAYVRLREVYWPHEVD